ncbi:MAG: glycosyltransferase, partial [Chitinophagaceae bacterium]
MRILHIITSLGRGGAEVLLSNSIPLLKEHEQHLVTFTEPHDQLTEITPFLSSHQCLNIGGRSQWPKAVIRLRRIIKTIKPDLVHVHMFIPALLTKLAIPKNIPLVYSLHNPYSIDAFNANRWAHAMEQFTARPQHHLIGVSEFVLQDYQQHIKNAGTMDVVYNMVGDEFFKNERPADYVPKAPLRCVSVGNLKPQKNYPFSLEAFQLLKDLPITLDIYGEDFMERQLEDFIAANKLNNVHLMGQSPNIEKVLDNYDLYLISSSYEGFGIALL